MNLDKGAIKTILTTFSYLLFIVLIYSLSITNGCRLFDDVEYGGEIELYSLEQILELNEHYDESDGCYDVAYIYQDNIVINSKLYAANQKNYLLWKDLYSILNEHKEVTALPDASYRYGDVANNLQAGDRMLNSNNIIEVFLEAVPEIKDIYKDEMEFWEGEFPGLHNIFGDVLNPFLLEQLKTEENSVLLQRIFDFLEKMATSIDSDIDNVLVVTILARIGDDIGWLKKAVKYMGSNTLKKSYQFEKELGRSLKSFQ
ncbi:hypothetical protein [Bacillus badius]|uniref:DUF7674 family protein n=1 Tax=Bacillus badius TaxID=1455 RepID=UPI0005ADC59E|nr:hypothetical protein [Bacillus badius]KIL74843.1 hypothetical protein SD78_1912 [Bacillus badius]